MEEAGWAAAEALVLDPNYALPAGSSYRPLLLRLVESAVQKFELQWDRIRNGSLAAASGMLVDHEATSVALSLLLSLSPQILG